jgi:hypothetical protein
LIPPPDSKMQADMLGKVIRKPVSQMTIKDKIIEDAYEHHEEYSRSSSPFRKIQVNVTSKFIFNHA